MVPLLEVFRRREISPDQVMDGNLLKIALGYKGAKRTWNIEKLVQEYLVVCRELVIV
jgi:hypothetical protein